MDVATKVISDSNRERVLLAMTELVGEVGYAEVEVEQIVERAGVTEEEFASMFADKEECGIAVQNAILADVVAAVSTSYSPDRSEMDSVVSGVQAILELMARKPSFAHFGYIGARQMSPHRVFAVYDAGHKIMEAMLERGWEYSDLNEQPRTAGLGALGAAEAIVRREIAGGRAGELPRLLPDLVYAATVPFLGQEEALRLAQRGRELLRGTEWA